MDGLIAYVLSKKYTDEHSGGAPSWEELTDKPFESIGANLGITDNGELYVAGADWGTITGTITSQSDLMNLFDAINSKISEQASSTNKLVSASEMGDAIEAVEANHIYATDSQGAFATKAALISASTFYYADGTVATPTKNDVAYVLADESHEGKTAKYSVASIAEGIITWGFVITFNNTTFTQAQMDAINSYITNTKREAYDAHIINQLNPHSVTKTQVGLGNVDNTSDSTKKTNFTGSIVSENNGFITGDMIYNALLKYISVEEQSFTAAQQAQARENIMAATVTLKEWGE